MFKAEKDLRMDEHVKKSSFTCKTMGVATAIMGITPEGRKAIEKMKQDTVRK